MFCWPWLRLRPSWTVHDTNTRHGNAGRVACGRDYTVLAGPASSGGMDVNGGGVVLLGRPPSPSSPAPLPPAEAAETPVPREWAALSLPPLAQPSKPRVGAATAFPADQRLPLQQWFVPIALVSMAPVVCVDGSCFNGSIVI